jgi:hypothetical protein
MVIFIAKSFLFFIFIPAHSFREQNISYPVCKTFANWKKVIIYCQLKKGCLPLFMGRAAAQARSEPHRGSAAPLTALGRRSYGAAQDISF